MLMGTAAGSIAAIASDHGVAAASADAQSGFPADMCAVGQLEGGALGSFFKEQTAFNVFLKWDGVSVEAFFKEQPSGGVQFFYKYHNKGWSPVSSMFLKEAASLQNAQDAFLKITPAGAEFFLKLHDLEGRWIVVDTLFDPTTGEFDLSEEPVDSNTT
jgi:hypothetical protein